MLQSHPGQLFTAFPGSMITSSSQQDAIRRWIETIMQRHRVEIPAVAARSGVAASTIYRWLEPDYQFTPSLTSLRKIARAFDAPMPAIEGQQTTLGFAEQDLTAFDHKQDFAGLPAGPNQGRWRVNTRALELAGYLPGDVVLVDQAVAPRPNDVVCAQVYDFKSGSADTKLRVFQPPYLVTLTMDPAASDMPLLVDGQRVVIVGTVIRSVRMRAA